jgi:hypothetical protein
VYRFAVLTLLFLSTSFLTVAFGDSIAVVTISELGLYDNDGKAVKQVLVGEQVSVQITASNNIDRGKSTVILLEIRDGSGITQYLAWQNVTMEAGSNYTFATSWTAERGCIGAPNECNYGYELRSLAVTDLQNPQVLGAVASVGDIAVIERSEQGNKLYRLMQYGKEYGIEYSIDSGFINHLEYDMELATIAAGLEGVANATDLTLHIPEEMLDDYFMCVIEEIPTSSIDGIVAFVDTIWTEIEGTDSAESLIVKVKLGAGTENVEIIGCAIP